MTGAAVCYRSLHESVTLSDAYASWIQAAEASGTLAAVVAAASATATPTWARTAAGQICHQLFPWDHEGERLSYKVAWNALRPAVLNATYYPDRFANESRFRAWVADVFEYHTYARLQKSQAHPAPPESIRKLWDVIRRRIEDPVNNGPVRIAVMGGSVTTGRDCQVNPVDLPGTYAEGTQRWCAYANRLQVLLNRVLFPRRSPLERSKYPVFEVVNMAVQATNSEVGAMAIEYNLLPALEEFPPHIVISSYSANDAWDDEASTFWRHQQSFVRAARTIWPCDDHLPLVVLADDWFSHGEELLTMALANTGSVYKTAAWNDLMAVMYSNTVRSASVFHSNFTESDGHPLFGSRRISEHHLGMGFHIGHGWALFFNLVGALHDACTEPQPTTLPFTKLRGTSTSSSSVSSIAAKLAREEALPDKYMGRYDGDGRNVLREWDENYKFKERLCDPATAAVQDPITTSTKLPEERPPFSTSNCAYAWMVNMMTNVWSGWEVQQAINHVLVRQVGWDVVDLQPKSGWRTNLTYASLTGTGAQLSHFTIEVMNISQPVDTFTLLSLKSYGPEWDGSEIYVDVRVFPGGGEGGGGRRNHKAVQGYVSGHHAKEISVPYPHRFRLQGEGAHIGDTIRATFTLTGGHNFFVSGIAFCRSLIGDMPESDSEGE